MDAQAQLPTTIQGRRETIIHFFTKAGRHP